MVEGDGPLLSGQKWLQTTILNCKEIMSSPIALNYCYDNIMHYSSWTNWGGGRSHRKT